MKVTVVLDPAFEAEAFRTLPLAVWLIDSVSNRQLAQRLSRRNWHDPNSAVFRADPMSSPVDIARSIFPTVCEHHPRWNSSAQSQATTLETTSTI